MAFPQLSESDLAMQSAVAAHVIPFEDDPPTAPAADGETESTIGQISREFGVSFRTLRFYEERQLIAPRRQGAVRAYGTEDRARLHTILKGKKLGFTLEEIRHLLAAAQGLQPHLLHLSREKCVEQIKLLERQKREIDAALTELRRCYSAPYLATFAGRAVGDRQSAIELVD